MLSIEKEKKRKREKEKEKKKNNLKRQFMTYLTIGEKIFLTSMTMTTNPYNLCTQKGEHGLNTSVSLTCYVPRLPNLLPTMPLLVNTE